MQFNQHQAAIWNDLWCPNKFIWSIVSTMGSMSGWIRLRNRLLGFHSHYMTWKLYIYRAFLAYPVVCCLQSSGCQIATNQTQHTQWCLSTTHLVNSIMRVPNIKIRQLTTAYNNHNGWIWLSGSSIQKRMVRTIIEYTKLHHNLTTF